MDTTFTQKRLNKYKKDCHDAAMGYIDLITSSAIEQAEYENLSLNVDTLTPEKIAKLAAKRLDLSFTEVYEEYLDLMLLEKMVEIV